MGDPELDRKLQSFLEETERERAHGHTIANLRVEINSLRSDVQEVATEQRLQKLRLDRHGRDIRAIKQHLEWNDEEMDTGQHQVVDLKRALAEKEAEIKARRDSGIWWKRQKWQWLIAALGAIALVGITTTLGVLGFFIARQLQQSPPPPVVQPAR